MGSCCSKSKEKTSKDNNRHKLKSNFALKLKEIKDEGVFVEAKETTKRHNARSDFHIFSLAMFATST
jgi:hypothetical protein